MKKKRKQHFPRAALKNLVQDIVKLIKTNEGRLLILELFEEIPYELRSEVVEGLSAFYQKEMAWFLYLLKLEYGSELTECCDRALDKYRLAGIDVTAPHFFEGDFYKAYATCTRQTSRITLDVAWKTKKDRVSVEGFYLTFSPDGVYSFFVIEDMPIAEFKQERDNLADMVELDYLQTCRLVQSAFNFNIGHMSRPALGRYLYQKYLDVDTGMDQLQTRHLIHSLSDRLTPRQVVNSMFHALRYQDFDYVSSLYTENMFSQNSFLGQFGNLTRPGTLVLEGQVKEVHGSRDAIEVVAYLTSIIDGEVYCTDFTIVLTRDHTGRWLIRAVNILANNKINPDAKLNPLNTSVYCRVYEISNIDELFELLDQIDNIREVEEIPNGMHMRVTAFDDDFNHGISLLSGVIADLVINGDEFVIITQEPDAISDLDELLTNQYTETVEFLGQYQVNLIDAFNYLAGQYTNFEDVLISQDPQFAFEDGMKFITARYLVKDYRKVAKRLHELADMEIDLNAETRLFYQTQSEANNLIFLAEYILSPNWLTLSTFGERDLGMVRNNFEAKMFNYLEYDGLEVHEEGLFEILTEDVKKRYPDLEKYIKEMYLNKWYYSHLATLKGMSPSEACQTEEGTRLLWTMFKKIKQKEKRRYKRGEANQINLKEYMRKVDLRKE
ncbi:MAG: hypothetical protein ACOX6I_05960 [Syntrophomonadaceae bacterium]|jgi:hypothetical protein